MTQTIALITGANKGLGLETARQLAQRGLHVILASRVRERGVEATLELQRAGLSAEALELDVTRSDSIAAAAREVERKHGHLDVLVNNAGILADDTARKPSEQTLDAWHKTFDTNLFAVVAVTQAFLPLLKKAPAARIVNVSSSLGSNTLHSDPAWQYYNFKVPAYNVSKSALNAWTVHLAWELKDTKIKVNAAHPGHVQTDMGGAGAPMKLVDGAKTSVALATLGADGPTGTFVHLGETIPW
jgi:NAD(P)-dependent dehydrogenase (short-subunit alcohol dehydrogenase family)